MTLKVYVDINVFKKFEQHGFNNKFNLEQFFTNPLETIFKFQLKINTQLLSQRCTKKKPNTIITLYTLKIYTVLRHWVTKLIIACNRRMEIQTRRHAWNDLLTSALHPTKGELRLNSSGVETWTNWIEAKYAITCSVHCLCIVFDTHACAVAYRFYFCGLKVRVRVGNYWKRKKSDHHW